MAVPVVYRPTRWYVDPFFGPAYQARTPRPWQPHTEVSETDAAYVVELEVPGLTRDEATVEVDGDRLRIRGEYKREENAEENAGSRVRTRRSGSFEYTARLPKTVDAEQISADLANGVLTVTVPKAEAPQARRVEITAA